MSKYSSAITPRDIMQVHAFNAFFTGATIGQRGHVKTHRQAFVNALVASSDEVFDRLLLHNPNLISDWHRQRKEIKVEQAKQEEPDYEEKQNDYDE